MSKTILQMFLGSKHRLLYILILAIPSLVLSIVIYNNVLNFTILLLVNFIAIFSTLILSFELFVQEEGNKIFLYLKSLQSENFVMIYRTLGIYTISSTCTIIMWTLMNIIYAQEIYIVQQVIYLVLILLALFFYVYFIQYLLLNFNNRLLRNSTIVAVTAISMLSLMTRSIATFMMYVTLTGLFLAVTFMNRRLTEELKREAHDQKY